MEVIFYYNQSDDRQIVKSLETGTVFEGVLRDECDIMTPIIRFEQIEVMRYNYCYIPQFQRYYSVKAVNAHRNGFFDVSMEVDVLMSFKGDILNLTAIVDKQTDVVNGDEYIDDSSLVTENLMYCEVYNFPSGFNENPEYILITAG